jgi:hypothetical protein
MRNDSIFASSIMENTPNESVSEYLKREKARYEEYAEMSSNEAFIAISDDIRSGRMYPISSIELINDRPGSDKSSPEKDLPPELIYKPWTVEEIKEVEELAQAYRAGMAELEDIELPSPREDIDDQSSDQPIQ